MLEDKCIATVLNKVFFNTSSIALHVYSSTSLCVCVRTCARLNSVTDFDVLHLFFSPRMAHLRWVTLDW